MIARMVLHDWKLDLSLPTVQRTLFEKKHLEFGPLKKRPLLKLDKFLHVINGLQSTTFLQLGSGSVLSLMTKKGFDSMDRTGSRVFGVILVSRGTFFQRGREEEVGS